MSSPKTRRNLLAQLVGPLHWLRTEGARGDLARGTVAAFSIRVIGIGLAMAVHVLLARLLGLTAFGEYTYVLSWLTVLAIVATLGLDSASLRFVAAYRASGEWALLRGFLRGSQTIAVLTAVVAAVVAAAIVALLREGASASLVRTAWIACLVLPLFVLLNLQSAALRAFKRIVAARLPMEILRPAILGLLVAGLFWRGPHWLSAPAAMLATLAAFAVCCAVTRVSLHVAVPRIAKEAPSRADTLAWIRVALPLLLMSGLQIILGQTDVIMVGALLDTDRAGIYAAATRLAMLVSLCLVAVNTIVAPTISELWTARKRVQLQRLLTVSARLALLATLPIVAALVLGGRFALGLFGQPFEQAYVPLLILAVGQLVSVAAGAVGYVMTMTGLELKAARIMAAVVVANLALNAALIPFFELWGAAIATAASTVAWNLAMLAVVRRERCLDSSCLLTRQVLRG